jgi:hypothetical protein
MDLVGKHWTAWVLITIGMLLSLTPGMGQRIWVSEHRHQADIAVFIADYTHRAHLLVWEAPYAHQASSGEGHWYMVEHRHQADVKVFLTSHAHQADLIIALVDYRHQAGWRDKPPKLSLAMIKALRYR